MKITYDKAANATYIKISDKEIAKTIEQDDYYIDLAKDGTIVGIEYLNIPTLEDLK